MQEYTIYRSLQKKTCNTEIKKDITSEKEQIEFQKQLFPDGPPTPEEFIQKIAELARKRMAEKQNQDHAV